MSNSKGYSFARKLTKTTLSIALGMCVAGGVQAQSNITGSIFGVAEAGQTITVRNLDTGLTRTITVGTDGKYRLLSLPNGRYKVELQKDGNVVSSRDNVEVLVSSGVEVNFSAAGADATQLDTVVVTGVPASIDISQVDVRTVFTAEQLAKIPIGRSINDVALLAPGVISSTSYSGYGSFGGAAASENAYYINGYAVTNPLTSIGYSTLPFDSIGQQQVLTGGYGAEFGRSTGGVVNIVTKRGGNEWKGGIYGIWTPGSLKGTPRNLYYPDTGFWGEDRTNPLERTDGTLYHYKRKNQSTSFTRGFYVSGPVIKDRLFIYANAEQTDTDGNSVGTTRTASAQSTGWNDYSYEYPRATAKIDWNITDNHLLELTGILDRTKYDVGRYAFNYDNFTHGNEKNSGVSTDDEAKLYVAKYTGYLTDTLTVSALYGQQKITHETTPFGYEPSCPYVSAPAAARVPGVTYNICQKYLSTVPVEGEEDKTDGWRLDVAWQLGDHEIRVGADRQNAESYRGSSYPGGYGWYYYKFDDPNEAVDAGHGVIGTPAQAGGYGAEGYFVERYYSTSEARVKVEQSSQYIEDRWQVTDNLLLSLGLRNEQFRNYTGGGEVYVSQRHQLAPRFGFSWDVGGESNLKIFGNAGRYHLALPNNVAIRAASGTLRTSEYFTYTGVDANGNPTGLTPITLDTTSPYVCPGTNGISSNLECGSAPDPRTIAAIDLKSHFQDEYIVGMEQILSSNYSWGAKLTYRDLKSAIDDTCAPALGGACFIFNPGESNSFWVEQDDGSFQKVHYSAEELNLPKLKRRYYALDLYLEHPFSDSWYGKIEYTFSRNYGNSEGQLHSDVDTGTGGQSDVSVTQDWDLPQLMFAANGLLPNNRTHQLKAFGYYQLTPEWRLGGSTIVQSGRPKSCTSYWPTPDPGLYNGAYYHYCGLPGDQEVSPRGAKGETPWTAIFNLNVAYTPTWANNNLTLQMDVLNVFDSQVATAYYNRYASSRTTVNPRYDQVLYYTDPRSVRFTVRYDF